MYTVYCIHKCTQKEKTKRDKESESFSAPNIHPPFSPGQPTVRTPKPYSS